MGWTSYQASFYKKDGKVDRKAECDKIFNDDMVAGDTNERKVIGKFEVLKSAMVGAVYYAAVKKTRFATETEPEQSRVFAAICLTSVDSKDTYNFSYKDLDETAGPWYCDCPKGILDLLSPTDNEWAKEWREKCYCNIEKKKRSLGRLPVGTIIEVVLPFDTQHRKKGEKVFLKKEPKFASNRTQWVVQTKTPEGAYVRSYCYFSQRLMTSLEDSAVIVQIG